MVQLIDHCRQNVEVPENREFHRSDLQMTSPTRSGASSLTVTLWAYRGDMEPPTWIDEDPGLFSMTPLPISGCLNLITENFTKLCLVQANVSHLPMSAKTNTSGKTYYQSPMFSIVLLFGFTEIQAQIAWTEKVSYSRLSTPALST